jgi:hypothetical protein
MTASATVDTNDTVRSARKPIHSPKDGRSSIKD